MRRLVPGLLALLLAACAGPAAAPKVPLDPALAQLHALFVGIDHYRYSSARQPGAAFDDLTGAVGDVQRFKAALEELYGVALDRPAAPACQSANGTSVTLTDTCATGAAIMAALGRQVDSAGPGETVLFYYAGHGSQYRDDTAFDQDSGYNGTILGSDARNPQAGANDSGEIFDVQLRAIKDRATAAGVYFVTIFDSCNSATATRNGAAGTARSAPPTTRKPPPAGVQDGRGGPGYWVHLAAAQDGEEAQETASGAVGVRAGVFTGALIEALRLPAIRHGTFGDIIREVRLRVADRGHVSQTPSGEGELTAALGRKGATAALFPARRKGGTIALQAGSLSGVTPGSRFALYASQSDAGSGKPPLAEAVVREVAAASATLAPDGPARGLPDDLVARETAHFLPPALLGVAIALPPGGARDAVLAALAGAGFARTDDSGAVQVLPSVRDPLAVSLRAADGTALAELGRPDAPDFAGHLEGELRKVARVQQLLSLRTVAAPAQAAAAPFALGTCVAAEPYRPFACPAVEIGGVQRIGRGRKFTATLINRGTAPAYLYLLAIDPLNAVTLVVPRRGEIDQKIAVGQPYRRAGIWAETPGIYRFVALASDSPVRADAFEQAGNGTRGVDACASPLERLICSANDGARDGSVAAIGQWSAAVTTLLVGGGEERR